MGFGTNLFVARCAVCLAQVNAGKGKLYHHSKLTGWKVLHPGPCVAAEALYWYAYYVAADRDGRPAFTNGDTKASDVLREWESCETHAPETVRLALAKAERIERKAA
jgi:hypothetical protein